VNTKSTGLLFARRALLFALIYFVERPARLAARIPPSRRVFAELDPAKITAVEVQVNGGASIIRAEKAGPLWQLTKPDPYPASGAMIEKLLDELAQWEWQTSIEHPNSWEEFGLLQGQFTLLLQGSGPERALKIGHISPVGDRVYVSARGSDEVLAAGTNALDWIPTNQLQWRDLTVLNLAGADYRRLQVRSTNWSFELELDAASHLWRMTKPIEARADTAKINEWLEQLRAMRVRRFVPEDAASAGPGGTAAGPETRQLVLTFLRNSGETNKALELQAGASPAGATNAQTNRVFARRCSRPA